MLLELDLPDGWTLQGRPDTHRTVVTGLGPVIELGPLAALPDEPRRWIESVMVQALPPGTRLGPPSEVNLQNDLGWPMECVRAEVQTPEGQVLEQRLGAFYKFNEWVAFALVRGRSLDDALPAISAALKSGRPRWQSPTVIAAIAELWT